MEKIISVFLLLLVSLCSSSECFAGSLKEGPVIREEASVFKKDGSTSDCDIIRWFAQSEDYVLCAQIKLIYTGYGKTQRRKVEEIPIGEVDISKTFGESIAKEYAEMKVEEARLKLAEKEGRTQKSIEEEQNEKWYETARSLQASGDFLSAVGMLTKVIEKEYKLKEAFLNRGDCYYSLIQRQKEGSGDFKDSPLIEKAMEDYGKAIEYGEDSGYANLKRGEIFWIFRGKSTEALKEYEKIISQYLPLTATAFYNKALVYQAKGSEKQANQSMRNAALLGYQKAKSIIEKEPQWGTQEKK